ncbi:MAG: glycosyltransferase family 39 protein [Pirellulales bacterium]|nr:glycosyltransferase family 39 protein [Pirellulales bacterium]
MLAGSLPKLSRLGRALGIVSREERIASLRQPVPLVGSESSVRKLVWAFVWLGVAARAVRYFLCFPLWEDECFVCFNLIDRGYAELLQPLDYHQVAPVLFLWLQLTVVKLLGFSEWTLRLIPFVCGITSVFLFRRLVAQLLTGLPLVCAVAVFAVSYPGIRYAAEAKPYGTDLFVGLVMLAMFVNWWQTPERTRWLWGMVVFAPLAIGISYPAAFVCGGISLAIAYALWKKESLAFANSSPSGEVVIDPLASRWLIWMAFNLLTLAAFGLTYHAASNQSGAELNFMQGFWGNAFPPLSSLTEFLAWLGITHTSDLLAYPVGGARGASSLTFLCCLVAVSALVRLRKKLLLVLAMGPLLLNLIAAAMQRYPYGGHVKFAQYHAAIICLVAGIGLAALLQMHARWIPSRGKLTVKLAFGALILIAAASMGRDIANPYKSTTDQRHRAFAQWFWFNTEFQGETVCLASDLDMRFSTETYADLSWSAMYHCNQRIYSPRQIDGRSPDWSRISADWPLRCVLFRAPRFDFDQQSQTDWLAEMQTKYKLDGVASYPFPCFGKREREAINVDYVDVFTFVPLPNSARTQPTVLVGKE